MSELPAPLTPPDCDLRDFGWMPIDIARLFGSEFHALSTDAEWRAGFTLWLRSYHQVPAASLPDDDMALARLAELGRDVKAWRKLKAGALRGWTICADGRRYHRTVAEKALEAWVDKLLQRKSSAAGNAKRYGLPFDSGPLDDAVRDSLSRLEALNPGSRALAKRFLRAGLKTPAGTPGDLPVGAETPPGGTPAGTPGDLPVGAETPPGGTPAGTPGDLPVGSQQNRTDPNRPEPTGFKESPVAPSEPLPPKGRRRCVKSSEPEDFRRWYEGYPHKVGVEDARKAFERVIRAKLATVEELIEGLEGYRRTKPPGREWCNPATWLNQQRWKDRPAEAIFIPNGFGPRPPGPPPVFEVRGVPVSEANILAAIDRWHNGEPWHDPFGPPPDDPGCRIPQAILERAKASRVDPHTSGRSH